MPVCPNASVLTDDSIVDPTVDPSAVSSPSAVPTVLSVARSSSALAVVLSVLAVLSVARSSSVLAVVSSALAVPSVARSPSAARRLFVVCSPSFVRCLSALAVV